MKGKKYIDKSNLLEKLARMIDYCKADNKVNGLTALFQVGDAIMDCKAEDVIKIVRCKDCKYFGNAMGGGYYKCNGEGISLTVANAFCSYGERKEKDDAEIH